MHGSERESKAVPVYPDGRNAAPPKIPPVASRMYVNNFLTQARMKCLVAIQAFGLLARAPVKAMRASNNEFIGCAKITLKACR